MSEEEEVPERLKELVQKHRVCWKVWPLSSYTSTHERVQVGFEIDVVGEDDNPAHSLTPGCAECETVYQALHEIAVWVCPPPGGETEHVIHSFDHSMHQAAEREYREEVELRVTIEHRTGYNAPLDASEVQSVQEIEQRLKALGARNGSWKHHGSS